jgi:hypothetical protein
VPVRADDELAVRELDGPGHVVDGGAVGECRRVAAGGRDVLAGDLELAALCDAMLSGAPRRSLPTLAEAKSIKWGRGKSTYRPYRESRM